MWPPSPWRWFAQDPAHKEEYFRQVYKSFDELEPYARAAGVKVALENLIVTPWQLQDEQFERLFDRYDPEFLGFTYDSGHATLQCCHDYYYFLRKYHSRLYAVHLQENHSIDPEMNNDDVEVLAHDSHWVPMDPRGGLIDWEEIAKWIARSPLDLPRISRWAFTATPPRRSSVSWWNAARPPKNSIRWCWPIKKRAEPACPAKGGAVPAPPLAGFPACRACF